MVLHISRPVSLADRPQDIRCSTPRRADKARQGYSGSNPEKFRRLIEDDIARWTTLVQSIGPRRPLKSGRRMTSSAKLPAITGAISRRPRPSSSEGRINRSTRGRASPLKSSCRRCPPSEPDGIEHIHQSPVLRRGNLIEAAALASPHECAKALFNGCGLQDSEAQCCQIIGHGSLRSEVGFSGAQVHALRRETDNHDPCDGRLCVRIDDGRPEHEPSEDTGWRCWQASPLGSCRSRYMLRPAATSWPSKCSLPVGKRSA